MKHTITIFAASIINSYNNKYYLYDIIPDNVDYSVPIYFNNLFKLEFGKHHRTINTHWELIET